MSRKFAADKIVLAREFLTIYEYAAKLMCYHNQAEGIVDDGLQDCARIIIDMMADPGPPPTMDQLRWTARMCNNANEFLDICECEICYEEKIRNIILPKKAKVPRGSI